MSNDLLLTLTPYLDLNLTLVIVAVCLVSSIGCISEAEARDALIRFVTERSCYGKSSAKEMDIYCINATSALRVSQCWVDDSLLDTSSSIREATGKTSYISDVVDSYDGHNL